MAKMSLEELRRRMLEGLTSSNMGVVLSIEHASIDDVRKLLSETGLISTFTMKLVKPNRSIQGLSPLIVVCFREEVCEKKCLAECGNRETESFGRCLYECIDSYRKIVESKLKEEIK